MADDPRRFLRYVLPGLVFGIDLVFLLWLLRPELVGPRLVAVKKEAGLALVAGSVFASGGLGLIFSSIHHVIHWRQGTLFVDHRLHLERLVKAGILELPDVGKDKGEQCAYIGRLTCEASWMVSVAIWNQLNLSGFT